MTREEIAIEIDFFDQRRKPISNSGAAVISMRTAAHP
jgi:hypothetical protein